MLQGAEPNGWSGLSALVRLFRPRLKAGYTRRSLADSVSDASSTLATSTILSQDVWRRPITIRVKSVLLLGSDTSSTLSSIRHCALISNML